MNPVHSVKNKKAGPRKPKGRKIAKEIAASRDANLDSVVNGSRNALSLPAMAYLECVADPKSSAGARSIFPDGGYQGETELIELNTQFDFAAGTTGQGYILVAPQGAGPFNNVTAITATLSTSVGTAATLLSSFTNVSNLPLSTAPYVAPLNRANMAYRCVAAALYIYPTGSATSQNGSIFLLEPPGHDLFAAGFTFQAAKDHRNTRAVRGIQVGDQSVLNCVNWHPTSSAISSSNGVSTITTVVNDVVFRAGSTAPLVAPVSTPELLVLVDGAAGSLFHVEYHVVYEAIGTNTTGGIAPYYDGRARDLIMNAWAHKNESGWVGRPSEARAAYHTAVADVKRKTAPMAQTKNDSSSWSDVLGFAKDVAGFFL